MWKMKKNTEYEQENEDYEDADYSDKKEYGKYYQMNGAMDDTPQG